MSAWHRIHILVYIIFSHKFCCAVVSKSEIDVLRELYEANGGHHWNWRNVSTKGPIWHFDTPSVNPCAEDGVTWQGLACSDIPFVCKSPAKTCSITAIHLPGYNLTGNICSCLGALKQLEFLNLPGNYLVGSIPPEYSALTSLKSLQLFDNFITGELTNTVYDMSLLQWLDLSSNLVRGSLSSAIGQLTDLIEIDLASNLLTGELPTVIGNLQQLIDLDLENNHFFGTIPSAIQHLTNLKKLSFQDNKFHGHLFSNLLGLTDLVKIDLSRNSFSGSFPVEIYRLQKLLYLEAHTMLMTGSLPPTLFNLTNLLDIDIRLNHFSGSLPSSIGQLKNASVIELSDCCLTGTIPTTIAYLTTAKSIYLHSNSFTGSIPRQLFLMPEVRDIQIQNNFLTGTIPSDIGAHSLLHEFQAHNNYLMGTIPSSIANLSFLYRISLANNFLTGPFVVPIRFTQQLDVTNNLLTGPISHMFVNLTLTQYLYFSENYFTGTIPEVISNYPQLVHLFLYDNLFTGTLPMFENCKFLETLLIQDNMFTGRPDDFLRAAGSLQVLDMSRNRFDKQLPREIWQLPKLRYVSIVETCSDGTIPREICDSSSLSVLILEGVRSGYGCREAYWDPTHFLLENAYYVESINSIVPDCIWTLSKLNTLHLSGNTLHGTIPDLINLPNLQSLSLSHNQFSGTIPALLSRSTRLMNFDLSHNKFSGTCNGFNDTDRGFIVPTGAMKLNVNRLSGDIPRTFFNSFDILDVLSGNVLTCSASRIELPDRDVERDNYTCGSNVFDISVILWICVIGTAVGCFLLVAGIVRYNCGRARLIIGVRDYIYSKKRELAVWGEYLDNESTIKAMPNFCKLIIVLKHFRKFINYLAIIILILYGIMYITAKLVLGWTTHKYQYRWLVTSAYMSSEQAAIWMLVLLCGLLAYASWGLLDITKVCSGISRTSKTSRDISTSYENRKELVTRGRISFKAVLYAFVLVVSHISIILAIKIAIIYSIVWSEVTANQKIALQLIMSFFDIVWNSTVIPLSCDMFQNLLQSDYRINLILLLLLFNSIVGPMLATAAVDRNCFSNLYKTEDPIESTYSQEYCSRFLSVFQAVDGCSTCDRTDVFYLSTSFDPPFTYSYACSSALITTFLPSLIFTYTLTIVLSPVVYSSLVAINGISERPRLCRFLTRAFPIVFFPYVETDFNNEALKIPMLSVKVLVARLLHNLAVMLTFGITCPFLALVISVETFCKTTMWMYLYGRYLYICSNGIIISENGPSKADVLLRFTLFFDRLEISCKDVWTGPAKSLHVILVHACLFSFILLMDIAGDKIGWKRALFRFCIPVMSLPLIFYIVHHLVQNTQLVPSFQNSASITTIGKVELRNTNSISTVRSPLVDLEHRRDTSDHQQELT